MDASEERLKLLADNLPEFMLQEYWQLRNEIRDRLNRKQAILIGTITAFTATAALTVTALGKVEPSWLLVAVIWLIPHLFLHPAIMLMRAETLSIVRLARYIRLHIELPFLEAMRKHPFTSDWRKPHGWETCLLVARIGIHALRASTKRTVGEEDNPWGNTAIATDARQAIIDGKTIDADQKRALQITEQSFRDGRRSVSWAFRGFASIAGLSSAFFALLAALFQKDDLSPVLPGVGLWVVVGIIIALSAAGIISMFVRVAAYKKADNLSSYRDIQSLSEEGLSRLIARFKDQPDPTSSRAASSP